MRKLLCLLAVLLCVAFPAGAAFEFPTDLTYIGEEAFAGNPGIQGEVIIPEGVETIGASAFENCTGITGLVLPESVKTIEAHAFSGCINLETVVSVDGRDIADTAFEGCDKVILAAATPVEEFQYRIFAWKVIITEYLGNREDIVIPHTIEGYPVATIGESVFEGNTTLKTIALPPTMTTIEQKAFYNCPNLTAVYGAENVVNYGDRAFMNCTNLSYLQLNREPEQLAYGCFENCSLPPVTLSSLIYSSLYFDYGYGESITIMYFEETETEAILKKVSFGANKMTATDYHVPAYFNGKPVTTIGEYAMAGWRQFVRIYLPSTVRTIETGAFNQCGNLVAIYGTENATVIGESAFGHSAELREVKLSPDLKRIECKTFLGCRKLESIELPEGLEYIGNQAFQGCISLKSIALPEGVEVGFIAFADCTSLTNVVLPEAITGKIAESVFSEAGIQIQAVKRVVAEVIKPGMTDFEKALALHDWLIYNARYDTDYVFYGAEGVLVFGRGVCQSYSEAYQLLLEEVGIENRRVHSLEMDHGWNLIKLNGEWYHVDCTWDDPVPDGGEVHSYFGLSDALMGQDHTWDDPASLPAANGTRYQYGVDNEPSATPLPVPTLPPNLESTPLPTAQPTPNQPETPIADFTYLVEGGGVKIKSYRGSSADVVVPAYIEGLPVTKIGVDAFRFLPVETVTLPSTVHTIESDAFGSCTSLRAVYGTSNVVRYEGAAFQGCTSLSYIYLSDSITHMGTYAFSECPLPDVVLCFPSDSPLRSWTNAYEYGESIIMCFFSVENGEATLTHASGSLSGWHLRIPGTYRGMPVTAIAPNTLAGYSCESKITALSIPNSVRVIGRNAFSDSKDLVTTVYTAGRILGEGAFANSPGVTLIDEVPPLATPVPEVTARPTATPTATPTPTPTPVPTATPAPTQTPEPTPQPTPDQPDPAAADFICEIYDGEVTIAGYTGDQANVLIPAYVWGLPVTTIGKNAFISNPTIVTVTLPETIRTIRSQAFTACENLTAVYGADNVTSYESFAFGMCSQLTSIDLGENIVRMDWGVFKGCPLPTIAMYFPSDSPLTNAYGYGASITMYFFSVENGEATLVNAHNGGSDEDEWDLYVPDTYNGAPVTAIGEYLNWGDLRLRYLRLPDSVRSIGTYAFANCSNLQALVYIKGRVLGEFAFWDCPGVTLIDDYPPVATPTPPPAVTATSVPTSTPRPTPTPTPVPTSVPTATQAPAATPTFTPEPTPSPDPFVTPVEDFRFAISNGEVTIMGYDGSAADVYVPATINGQPVTKIAYQAFRDSSSLETITLPETMREIKTQAFAYCTNLTAVYGAEYVTCYEGSAFEGCGKLQSIVLGESITQLGANSFHGCSMLDVALYLPADSPLSSAWAYGEGVSLYFFEVKNGEAVLVGGSNGGMEKWHVSVPETYRGMPVTAIADMAFYWDHSIGGLSLPNCVKTIGTEAFNDCPYLKTTVYTGGRVLGEGAFDNCPGVTLIDEAPPAATPAPTPKPQKGVEGDFAYTIARGEVFITGYRGSNAHVVVPETIQGQNVTVIDANAFANCSAMITVTLPGTTHTIDQQAFWGCGNLEAVYGTENVAYFGDLAFSGCTKLAEVTIGAGVVKIAYGCFANCPMLDIVLCLPADSPLTSAYEYGENVSMYFFEERNGEAVLVGGSCGAEGTWTVCVPGGYKGMPVTTIGKQAFSWDQNVGGLILPESIKVIEAEAFSNCPSLIATVYTAGVEIGSGAFYNCPGVTLLNEVPPEN